MDESLQIWVWVAQFALSLNLKTSLNENKRTERTAAIMKSMSLRRIRKIKLAGQLHSRNLWQKIWGEASKVIRSCQPAQHCMKKSLAYKSWYERHNLALPRRFHYVKCKCIPPRQPGNQLQIVQHSVIIFKTRNQTGELPPTVTHIAYLKNEPKCV